MTATDDKFVEAMANLGDAMTEVKSAVEDLGTALASAPATAEDLISATPKCFACGAVLTRQDTDRKRESMCLGCHEIVPVCFDCAVKDRLGKVKLNHCILEELAKMQTSSAEAAKELWEKRGR